MRNVMLAIAGIIISVYVCVIGMNVMIIQVQKNSLEKEASRIVENALQIGYQTKDMECVRQILDEGFGVEGENQISVELKSADLEKGLLSVVVKKQIVLITRVKRELVVERTTIVDRMELHVPMVKILFIVDDEVYKEYHLERGEECPMPKPPNGLFAGWIEYGREDVFVRQIGRVWEDKIYLAKTK